MEENPSHSHQPPQVDLRSQDISDADHDLSRSFGVDGLQAGLTDEQKSLMSKLYKTGLKKAKSKSHIKFLQLCQKFKLVPKGLSFQKQKYEKQVENILANAEDVRIKLEISNQIKIVNEHRKAYNDIVSKINTTFDEKNKDLLMNKFVKAEERWRRNLWKGKQKKFTELKEKEKENVENDYEVKTMFGEFWSRVKTKRRRRKMAKKKKKILKKEQKKG
jgi:hypothetical protein